MKTILPAKSLSYNYPFLGEYSQSLLLLREVDGCYMEAGPSIYCRDIMHNIIVYSKLGLNPECELNPTKIISTDPLVICLYKLSRPKNLLKLLHEVEVILGVEDTDKATVETCLLHDTEVSVLRLGKKWTDYYITASILTLLIRANVLLGCTKLSTFADKLFHAILCSDIDLMNSLVGAYSGSELEVLSDVLTAPERYTIVTDKDLINIQKYTTREIEAFTPDENSIFDIRKIGRLTTFKIAEHMGFYSTLYLLN